MARNSAEELRYQRRSISFDLGLYATAMEMSYDDKKDSNFELLNKRVRRKAYWSAESSTEEEVNIIHYLYLIQNKTIYRWTIVYNVCSKQNKINK